MPAPTTLMVIGGSGFFGKSILDAHRRDLLAPWGIDRIIVVARRADALASEHPALVGDTVSLVNADVATAADLPAADYVIHAASSSDARRYAEFPQEERANILGAIENYRTIARGRHAASRIVYCSSGAVYGAQPASLAALDEDFEPGGVEELVAYKRDYAEAKRIAERRIAALGELGLRVSIARCFAFVGPYLPRDRHFAIGNFLADGLAGRAVRVLADRPVYRSYMHADDLVRWLMTIAAAADASCPIYNVGSAEGLIMDEIAALVAGKFGVGLRVAERRAEVADRYIPSIAKARRVLGLRLVRDLDSAVDATITAVRAGLQAP